MTVSSSALCLRQKPKTSGLGSENGFYVIYALTLIGGRIFEGLPREFSTGRYHSLFTIRETLPPDLVVTAESEDGVVMAIEHRTLPFAAVQFHPESILTLADDIALGLLRNVVTILTPRVAPAA